MQVFAGDRVREDEVGGGEVESVLSQPVVKEMVVVSVAVLHVADDWVVDVVEVTAKLMLAASLRHEFQQ